MIRWNSSDAYGLFAGLTDRAPIETQDQAALILHQARVRATIAGARRRERIAARLVAVLLWTILVVVVLGVWVLLSPWLDSPRDHMELGGRVVVRGGV